MAKYILFRCDKCNIVKEVEANMENMMLEGPLDWWKVEHRKGEEVKIFHNQNCLQSWLMGG